MGDRSRRPAARVGIFLWSAALCFASGAALAQSVPVTRYVVVQPIDVCSNTGTNCAPFNTKSAFGNPTNQNQTTNPIGFVVNPATGAPYPATGGVNITRALLNQVGIDVTFNNIVQYNSPLKSDGTTYQTLNVVQTTNAAGSVIFQSQDFLTLSQQPGISGNPPPAKAPTTPLAAQPTVINMFFVTKLNPPAQQAGGQLYDFSWINNNGVSIGGNTFFPPFPLTPRIDTLAHGIMHDLGLDHTTFGAGPYDPYNAVSNPNGGVLPPIPASPFLGECNASYPACMANLMTTGNLRTEPTVACVLATPPLPAGCLGKPTVANGLADQVATEVDQGPLLPVSQQAEVVKSGFLNPIPLSTTTASDPPESSSITFNVTGAANGRPNQTLLAWVLTLPSGLKFNRQFHILSESRQNLLQDADFPHPDSDNSNSGHYNLGPIYNECTAASAQCLIMEFNLPGADSSDDIKFSKGFTTAVTNADLCGADITLIFSDGYSTTGALGPCPGGVAPATLTANSQNPDLTAPVPPQIVNQTAFTAATARSLPCIGGNPTTGQCPADPTMTGVEDANPSTEGGQICYFEGSPIQCP